MGVIYVAVNVRNGAMYVGKTVQRFERRKQAHKIGSEKANTHFYKAIRKYGWDSFSWVVIDEVSNDELNAAEMEYIAYYKGIGKHVYNETDGGEGLIGYKIPRDAVERRVAKNTGKKRTDEQKERMSLAQRGRTISDSHKEKLSIVNTGKKLPDETKNRISASLKGKNTRIYTIIDNEDNIVVVDNMKVFCKERGLKYNSMMTMVAGLRNSVYGYRLAK